MLGGSVYAAKERRRRLLQKLKNASATQMLESVMGMLHLRGLLRAYQGDEEDMALVLQKLSRRFLSGTLSCFWRPWSEKLLAIHRSPIKKEKMPVL